MLMCEICGCIKVFAINLDYFIRVYKIILNMSTVLLEYIDLLILNLTTRKQTNRASLNIIRAIKTFKLYYYSPLNSDSNGRIGKQLR